MAKKPKIHPKSKLKNYPRADVEKKTSAPKPPKIIKELGRPAKRSPKIKKSPPPIFKD